MSDRKMGRPFKSKAPAFPVEKVDRLLVHGEAVEDDDGVTHIHYPSYRELAERFGVAHSLIGRYAKRHNCLARRKRAQKQAKELSDEKLIELRAEVLAISRDDQVRIIDRYLVGFEQALAEGRVRFDNPSDFNLMCRLKHFVNGEADSRQETLTGMPTLEELQRRHKEMLERVANTTPAEFGVAPPRPQDVAEGPQEDDGEPPVILPKPELATD